MVMETGTPLGFSITRSMSRQRRSTGALCGAKHGVGAALEPQATDMKRGAPSTICESPGGRRDTPSAQPPSGTVQALLYF
ncbi:hypothetical protein AV530_015215 [Patagioenas fasciata monilis]|uniref:Uncharacterized protein n=1 Tax=Patagioenas fasciata monilis TaxID=372326 RepID=A0A1V4K1C1_PATFA|nr:hypothetical protein AV530_015215 [Patagioenas fasciata monilis]